MQAPTTTTVHSLEFDARRPIGPLNDDETCTFGPKKVSFNAKSSAGYTHGMQLKRLQPRTDLHHVFSLKMSGLKQEYGWNAVAVVMNKYDGNPDTDDMFKVAYAMPHDLWIYSQFTCPWENTLLTLVVSPTNAVIEAYVEMAADPTAKESKKRTREDDEAMPYLPKDDKDLWNDFSNGMKHRNFKGTFMDGKLPNIGVKLCGSIGNAVEIVPASSRVVDHLNEKHGPESLMIYN